MKVQRKKKKSECQRNEDSGKEKMECKREMKIQKKRNEDSVRKEKGRAKDEER